MGNDIEQAIDAAIQSVIATHEGGFVTKWVALVESVNTDGERGLWTCTSGDVKAWDTVGLLQHGLHLQQWATLNRSDDDDGD